ncbi:MAG: glycosyltransferase [Bacteroidota bacterium]
MTERPLVSLIIMAYKAEKFVREAIEGAFAQTYENLEIILSDDTSPDRTFEIMSEMAAAYTGPHKVILNRNPVNLGIGAHVNKLWHETVTGEWIVVSAGDDVSLPERVSELMDIATEDTALIHGRPLAIDDKSVQFEFEERFEKVNLPILERNDVEETILSYTCVRGATMAINRKFLRFWGGFIPGLVNEDVILAYRAQFWGKLVYTRKPLIKYRVHDESLSNRPQPKTFDAYKRHQSKMANEYLHIYKQVMIDNEKLKLSAATVAVLEERKKYHETIFFLYGSGGFKTEFLGSGLFYRQLVKRMLIKVYRAVKR